VNSLYHHCPFVWDLRAVSPPSFHELNQCMHNLIDHLVTGDLFPCPYVVSINLAFQDLFSSSFNVKS